MPENPLRTIIHLYKKEKRGSLYLLLVPLSKALALPIWSERATQKPTPNMNIPPYYTTTYYYGVAEE